jgi:predicted RNA binding protein YcfA (HicA-like mRNA interferase family)
VRLPRDVPGADLAKRLERLGYEVTRRSGSHVRLTFADPPEHHVTIPCHDSLRVGTLAAILQAVAARHGMRRDELTARLFE